MRGPSYNIPAVQLIGNNSGSGTTAGVTYDVNQSWSTTAPEGIVFAKETPVYTGFNTTVDPNGFLKAASPIVKLFGDGSVSSLHFRRDLLLKRIFSIVSLSIVLPLVTETSSIDAIRTVA